VGAVSEVTGKADAGGRARGETGSVCSPRIWRSARVVAQTPDDRLFWLLIALHGCAYHPRERRRKKRWLVERSQWDNDNAISKELAAGHRYRQGQACLANATRTSQRQQARLFVRQKSRGARHLLFAANERCRRLRKTGRRKRAEEWIWSSDREDWGR
jgi:hypothetical protein